MLCLREVLDEIFLESPIGKDEPCDNGETEVNSAPVGCNQNQETSQMMSSNESAGQQPIVVECKSGRTEELESWNTDSGNPNTNSVSAPMTQKKKINSRIMLRMNSEH